MRGGESGAATAPARHDANQRTEFLGIHFDRPTLAEALRWVDERQVTSPFSYAVTPNVDHAVMVNEPGAEPWRGAYRTALAASDLTINDSRILARLALLSGVTLPVTPGSDLVREWVAQAAKRQGGSLALVGGRAEEAAWLRQTLPRWHVIHFDPPMGVRDDSAAQTAIAEFVEGAGANLVLFAIGAPQSEIVAHAIARRGKAGGVGLCIGASVEFLSGAKRRAPRLMQRAGLEWLFRLASEPGRLWRRYLLRGPRVFRLWWLDRQGRSGS